MNKRVTVSVVIEIIKVEKPLWYDFVNIHVSPKFNFEMLEFRVPPRTRTSNDGNFYFWLMCDLSTRKFL